MRGEFLAHVAPPLGICVFRSHALGRHDGPDDRMGQAVYVEWIRQRFRDQCNDAGLPQCSAHGLRKARATILAERGATDRQLMAVFGWESEKEATKYTKAANRKRLAAAAMRLEDRNENLDCPTRLSHQKKV
jgi:integrase